VAAVAPLAAALAAGIVAGLSSAASAQAAPRDSVRLRQAPWTLEKPAQRGFGALWASSIAVRREMVACMGGSVSDSAVRITEVRPLGAAEQEGDSLNAPAERSIAECGPPRWVGTAHSHVRSTDDPDPAPGFSAQDRMVMSLWSSRWAAQGAFCVLYGPHSAHCETYPLHRAPPTLPTAP
jgi:hypothetical protein